MPFKVYRVQIVEAANLCQTQMAPFRGVGAHVVEVRELGPYLLLPNIDSA